MSSLTSKQDKKKRTEWAKIEASIKSSKLSSPKEYALEWGRLREEFYRQNGPLEVPKPDLDRLKSLKNKYKGKRIFIMGNGPSLNKTHLEFLKNEYTFGVNRIYLMDDKISWKPSFYTANDWRVVPDIATDINGLTGSTFFFEESFRGILREGSDTYYYRHCAADPNYPDEKSFGHEATRGIRGAGSVVGTAVQLAAYMGFDPIYLIGCDLGYKVLDTVEQSGEDKFGNGVKLFLTSTKDDDPNHFDSRYFGKGQRWHDPNVKRMISGHEQCKAGMADKGGEIYNATVGGELEVYPRVDFNSLFPVQNHPGEPRDAGAKFDETELVSELFKSNKKPKIMLDVGAHRGTSAKYFPGDDWRIFCFEPDPNNREGLTKHSKSQSNIVKIDPRAVGSVPEKGKKFYGSDESSGISGMLAFRDTHEVIATVDVTSVGEIMEENDISHIDFLKIDVEGYDFGVLKGVPWKKIKPDVIECEYEDAKTELLGHTWRDICEYLAERNYTIYISEWHPIIRYGIPHDWHTIKKFPCELSDEKSWGNLLAFKNDPGEAAIIEAMEKIIRYRNKPDTSKQPIDQTSKASSGPTKKTVIQTSGESSNSVKRIGSQSIRQTSVAPAIAQTSQATETGFKDKLRTNSPSLFRIGQLGMWGLRFAKRHLLLTTVAAGTLASLILAPLLFEALEPYTLFAWGLAGLLIVAGSAVLLSSFVNMMANRIAEREIQARESLRADVLNTLRREQRNQKSQLTQSIKQMNMQKENSVLSNLDRRIGNRVSSELSTQENKIADRLLQESKTLLGKMQNFEDEIKGEMNTASTETEAKLRAAFESLEEQFTAESKAFQNKLDVLSNNLDEKLKSSQTDSSELDHLKKVIEDTQNRLNEESKRNSTSFMQAHEQLEERLQNKIDTLGKYAQDTRENVNKHRETMREHLIDSKTRNSNLDAHIKEAKAMIADLKEQLNAASERMKKNDSEQALQHASVKDKLLVLDDAQQDIRRLENEIASARNEIRKDKESEEANFQHFNRIFTKAHTAEVQNSWVKPLNLTMRPASIAYLAKRIATIESRLKGRLATTIEAAVLRTLVASSVQGKTLDVLEIGTLFGTGVAMIHDHVKNNYENTHITIIDPLEGYYGNNTLDIATGEKINKDVLTDNLATAKVPVKDYTLLQGFSTEDAIIEAAAKKKYDVLIIDGDHSLAGVKADFVNYAPFVKRGGYIIVDDYGTPDWPEIEKYVDEELIPRSDITLVGSMWRTAVFRVIKVVET